MINENYWKQKYHELKAINDHAEQIYTNIGYSNAVKEYSPLIDKLKESISILTEKIENIEKTQNNVSNIDAGELTEKTNSSYAIYAIDMYEYERGWGLRSDGTVYFRTREEALVF